MHKFCHNYLQSIYRIFLIQKLLGVQIHNKLNFDLHYKNFAKFTRKHLYRSHISNKVVDLTPEVCNFIVGLTPAVCHFIVDLKTEVCNFIKDLTPAVCHFIVDLTPEVCKFIVGLATEVFNFI